jgi:hypothetical protein
VKASPRIGGIGCGATPSGTNLQHPADILVPSDKKRVAGEKLLHTMAASGTRQYLLETVLFAVRITTGDYVGDVVAIAGAPVERTVAAASSSCRRPFSVSARRGL